MGGLCQRTSVHISQCQVCKYHCLPAKLCLRGQKCARYAGRKQQIWVRQSNISQIIIHILCCLRSSRSKISPCSNGQLALNTHKNSRTLTYLRTCISLDLLNSTMFFHQQVPKHYRNWASIGVYTTVVTSAKHCITRCSATGHTPEGCTPVLQIVKINNSLPGYSDPRQIFGWIKSNVYRVRTEYSSNVDVELGPAKSINRYKMRSHHTLNSNRTHTGRGARPGWRGTVHLQIETQRTGRAAWL